MNAVWLQAKIYLRGAQIMRGQRAKPQTRPWSLVTVTSGTGSSIADRVSFIAIKDLNGKNQMDDRQQLKVSRNGSVKLPASVLEG